MFQKQLKIDSRARDFKGVKVGKLLPLKIISNVSTKNNSGYLWECKCDCGNIITVPSWDLSGTRFIIDNQSSGEIPTSYLNIIDSEVIGNNIIAYHSTKTNTDSRETPPRWVFPEDIEAFILQYG